MHALSQPAAFCVAVVGSLFSRGLWDALVRLASGLLLAVEACLRLSEMLAVRAADFLPPAPGGVESWVLLLQPSARGERSKVGPQYDMIPVDPRRSAALAPVMEALARRPRKERLLDLDYSQWLEGTICTPSISTWP